MDTDSYVQIHRDRDVSSQFLLSFGEYSGGEFLQLNDKTNEFEVVDTYNQIVQLDGRYKHYVINVTNGLRFSIVVYKMFDICLH